MSGLTQRFENMTMTSVQNKENIRFTNTKILQEKDQNVTNTITKVEVRSIWIFREMLNLLTPWN